MQSALYNGGHHPCWRVICLTWLSQSVSVYPACEQVLISGALGRFPAYAVAEIAPLRRSLINIQKRKCRSIASIWSSAGVLVSLSCWRTAGPQDHRLLCVSLLTPQFCFVLVFPLVVLHLVFIVCRWQLKGTLSFAPCVYKRLGFLLSGTCKRSVVIPC